LVANVAGTRTTAELLGLIQTQGRAQATTLMVDAPANLAAVEAAGLATSGIDCALEFAGQALFVLPG
jgi:hypothetical protein